MASLYKHNGGWRIQFFDIDGKRKSFFPGVIPRKNALQIKTHIEAIVAANASETAIPINTMN